MGNPHPLCGRQRRRRDAGVGLPPLPVPLERRWPPPRRRTERASVSRLPDRRHVDRIPHSERADEPGGAVGRAGPPPRSLPTRSGAAAGADAVGAELLVVGLGRVDLRLVEPLAPGGHRHRRGRPGDQHLHLPAARPADPPPDRPGSGRPGSRPAPEGRRAAHLAILATGQRAAAARGGLGITHVPDRPCDASLAAGGAARRRAGSGRSSDVGGRFLHWSAHRAGAPRDGRGGRGQLRCAGTPRRRRRPGTPGGRLQLDDRGP